MPRTRGRIVLLIAILLAHWFHESFAAEHGKARVDRYGDPFPPGAIARLGTTRFRHSHWITTAAFSPDGKWLASADVEGRVYLWQWPGGKLHKSWNVTPRSAATVLWSDRHIQTPQLCFSGDGREIIIAHGAAAEETKQLTQYNVSSGKKLGQAKLAIGNGDVVREWCFSPDRKRLGVRVVSGNVLEFSVPTGDVLHRASGLETMRWHFVYTSNGALCHSQKGDSLRDFILLRECFSGKLRCHYLDLPCPSETNALLELLRAEWLWFSPGEEHAVVALWDRLQIRDGRSDRIRCQHRLPSPVQSLVFSPDGSRFFTAHWDQHLRGWETSTGKQLFRTREGLLTEGCRPRMICSPDGKWVLVHLEEDGCFSIHSTSNGATKEPAHKSHRERIVDLRFVGGEDTLVSLDRGGNLIEWNPRTGRQIRRDSIPDWENGLDPTGAYVKVSDGWWSRSTGRALKITSDDPYEWLTTTFSQDGKWIIREGKPADSPEKVQVEIRSTATGKIKKRLQSSRKEWRTFNASVLSPDNRRFFTTEEEQQPAMLDLNTGVRTEFPPPVLPARPGEDGEPDTEWLAHFRDRDHLSISADGRWLIGTLCGGLLLVWEVETGAVIYSRWNVAQSRPTPDPRRVVLVTAQNQVLLLDLVTRQTTPLAPKDLVSIVDIAVSPKGDLFATAHADTTILTWDLKSALKQREDLSKGKTVAELKALVKQLRHPDVKTACRATWTLMDAGERVIPWLRDVIKRQPLRPEKIKAWIGQLDARRFAVREAAQQQLRENLRHAEPHLRAHLKGKSSPEQQQRITKLLASMRKDRVNPEILLKLRVISILEHLGTAKAKTFLRELQ